MRVPVSAPRRCTSRFKAVVSVAALAAATLLSVTDPAYANVQPSAQAPPGAAETTRQVTLITGDRVTLSDNGSGGYAVSSQAAARPGGKQAVLSTYRGPEGVYVIPDDAYLDVLGGRLDRELFNVSYQAESGYADDKTKQLPVIVQYPKAVAPAAVEDRADALPGSEATRDLRSVRGAAAVITKAEAGRFWATVRGAAPTAKKTVLGAGIAKVWLDRKVQATLDESVPLVGAPKAWSAGHDGKGVKVAVLDTGIDAGHPDLDGKVAESKSFVPNLAVKDGNGHGTHVASTIAGSGAAVGGKRKGVAPGAELVVGKVLDNGGKGDWSWIIAGMEWASRSGAKVINMSLGGGATDGTDPISQSVNDLTASTGSLFVIAAGNASQPETVATPGTADAALTVAATDKNDKRTSFSSQGPRLDGALKPDIAAPGLGIVAARADGTTMGPVVDGKYVRANGTSMATPHVAGAAAIMAQLHPDWKPAQIKTALMSTAHDAGLNAYQQGAGRLDVARAHRQQVLATTASLDFGNVPLGKKSAPVTKQIGYTNPGGKPVTLTLGTALRNVKGDTADGALKTDKNVTIPAGGTASVTVTLDASDLPRNEYTGAVTATDEASGVRLTTPVGLVRWPPMVTLTVRTLGRDGKPAWPANLDVVDVTKGGKGRIKQAYAPETGVIAALVPEGAYSVAEMYHWVDEGSRPNYATLANPEITVKGDTEITLDARKAKQVTFRTPKPSEPLDSVRYWVLQRSTADGDRYSVALGGNGWTRVNATPTSRVTTGKFQYATHSTLGKQKADLSVLRPRPATLHPATLISQHGTDGISGYPGHVPITGTRDLQLADAGEGRPEDIAGRDLRGKIALMRGTQKANGVCEIWLERLGAIRDAGAVAVAAYPPAGLGCPIPMDINKLRTTPPGTPVGIGHVAIPATEATALQAQLFRSRVTLRLSGTPQTPHTYTLAPYEEGRIPRSLNYRLGAGQLARIDLTPHESQPYRYSYSHATGMRDSIEHLGANAHSMAPDDTPVKLREYVGPVSSRVLHSRMAAQWSQSGNLVGRTAREVFDRPGHVRQSLFTAPSTPGTQILSRATDRFVTSPGPDRNVPTQPASLFARNGDRFDSLFPMVAGNGLESAVAEPPLSFERHLYRGDTEIPMNPGFPYGTYTLPPEQASYRFTARSPRTDATWTFRSARPDKDTIRPGYGCRLRSITGTGSCRAEAFVLVGYDLGRSLASDNSVAVGGGRHSFRVTAYHPPAGVRMPKIAGLKLWYSTDDGAQWRAASVRRGHDGAFTATATYPKLAATTGAVTLKAEAWDADGNRLVLITKRAFALRDTP